MDKNEAGRTTLHGGIAGFSDRNWSLHRISPSECHLTLHHPDGFGGFPGNVQVTAVYKLDQRGALEVEIIGKTDPPTYFSPAFHGYWNLSGTLDVLNHRLRIDAETYLPVDTHQIPIGPPESVTGTPLDYRTARKIGQALDHNFCLSLDAGRMQPACQLFASDLVLTVTTDQPGVQIYNGQHINSGSAKGHESRVYGACAGVAIEPQFWPDAPHQPSYPSSLLLPGQSARHRSLFHIARVPAAE